MDVQIRGTTLRRPVTGVVVEKLFEFFFKNRKAQYMVYLCSFSVAFAYAIVSDFFLGRTQQIVTVESIVLASVLLACLPVAYVLGILRSEGNFQRQRDPINDFSNAVDAIAKRQVAEMTTAVAAITSLLQLSVDNTAADRQSSVTKTIDETQKEFVKVLWRLFDEQNRHFERLLEEKVSEALRANSELISSTFPRKVVVPTDEEGNMLIEINRLKSEFIVNARNEIEASLQSVMSLAELL